MRYKRIYILQYSALFSCKKHGPTCLSLRFPVNPPRPFIPRPPRSRLPLASPPIITAYGYASISQSLYSRFIHSLHSAITTLTSYAAFFSALDRPTSYPHANIRKKGIKKEAPGHFTGASLKTDGLKHEPKHGHDTRIERL